MDVVFLGINDAGWEIYEWLCDRDGVSVEALVTTGEQLSLVERLEPDVVVAAGYRHVVPEEVLAIPPEGCINVHPGYLPHARGFNPNVWSIVEDLPAGATMHYMDPGIDTGDVIARRRVETRFDDTGRSLYRRIERACVDLFEESWPDIEAGDVEATEQSDEEATYHYRADFEALCRIDPEERYEAGEFVDVLRALTFPPFDNAFIEVDGERYYLELEVTPAAETEDVDRVGTLSSY